MTPLRPTPTVLRNLTLFRTINPRRAHSTSSVSADEVSHFSSLASSWWDPMGPSRVLHLMNPLRHDFIASCLSETHESTTTNSLHYLDVGCGGGIFAESLARTIPSSCPKETATTLTHTRAASITAIDPTATLIQIARDHACTDPKVSAHLRDGRFRYVNCTLEDVVAGSLQKCSPQSNNNAIEAQKNKRPTEEEGKQLYDVITLFEVIEHIDANAGSSSPLTFLTNCLKLLKPGGWLIGSTIARTFPSFLVNQVIAEAPWPIGVVPKGTHEWSKFVNPNELESWAQEGLMRCRDGELTRAGSKALQGMKWKCSGVMYFPGLGWKFVGGSEDWGNYFWAVRKGV